jgi:hypothetical protein
MRHTKLIPAAIALAALSFSVTKINAQATAYNSGSPKADPAKKPTPRSADGHPDLTGYWVGGVAGISQAAAGEQLTTKSADGSVFFDYGGANGGGGNKPEGKAKEDPNQPSYKPEYLAKVQEVAKTMYGGSTNLDPYLECKPLGVPRAITERPIMEIAQTPSVIIVAHEAAPGPVYRVFYMNAEHPKDIDTSFMGNSVAHWDGDTLVVDTVGLNDETWLSDTRGGKDLTTLHSDKEHVVERWTRTGDVINYQATVEDPVMFTKPWVIKPMRIAAGAPGDYIQPSTCIPLDKGHLIEESDKDHYECNFCQKSVDKTYGDGASKDQKADDK